MKKIVYQRAIPILGKYNLKKNKYVNVIYYHDIVQGEGESYQKTNLDIFKEHMDYIYNHGYQTYTFADLDDPENTVFQKKSVLITFDDGWQSNYSEVFEFMNKRNLKYNVFLAAGLIGQDPAYLTWDMVKEMAQTSFVGFGAHTYDHVACRSLEEVDTKRQIILANELIGKHTGYPPKDFCFPFGQYNQQSLEYFLRNTQYTRLYTSNMIYTYCENDKLVFGRNAINNDESENIFKKKLMGYYNVFGTLCGIGKEKKHE